MEFSQRKTERSTITAIKATNLHKKFKVYFDKGNTLKERVLFKNRNRHEDRWVLKGVDIEIMRGESVGLIGENGSGKSTFLKILSKILYPNQGVVELNGRVSSLLELGAGFHPDLSGRENIYNNASIFGLDEKEIDKRLPAIIDFSELHDLIDNPVRTYSSGMYMRLAFSVAINVDADILLIDEILAVGDANFQRKCFNMLREIKRNGTTILIVSHSLGSIEQFCDRSIWLEDGKIRMDGDPRSVHNEYLEYMDNRARQEAAMLAEAKLERGTETIEEEAEAEVVAETSPKDGEEEPDAASEESANPYASNKKRFGNKGYEITNVRMVDSQQVETLFFQTGKPLTIEIDYKRNLEEPLQPDAVIGIGVFRNDGLCCYGTNTFLDYGHPIELDSTGKVTFSTENLLLNGLYSLDVAIESTNGFPYDYIKGVLEFEVVSTINDVGAMRMVHEWNIKESE